MHHLTSSSQKKRKNSRTYYKIWSTLQLELSPLGQCPVTHLLCYYHLACCASEKTRKTLRTCCRLPSGSLTSVLP
ncbi:hypothetical protein V5799_025946 [Amblyomma americanum]|uniref:Uncharacterized protein n=1 Tax=Amblyomma americanum TaxID=6943 RepID=A0AAQ4DJZ7_AMBAM